MALAVSLFYASAELAPGGLVGVGIILNVTLGLPLGLVVLIGNAVLLSLGYRQLGGWNIVFLTVFSAIVFSVNIDIFRSFLPPEGVSDDRLLNAIFGGVVGGIGGGIVYRAGGTPGGTTVISRIIHKRFGVPTSSAYLYVDSFVVGAAGILLGWEAALLSFVTLFMDGMMSDYILDGPSLVRTANIITDKPVEVSWAIMTNLNRGVTAWEGKGMYTEREHSFLFVTISRGEMAALRDAVSAIDERAFIVFGQGHTAYGGGFKRMGRAGRLPGQLPTTPEMDVSTAMPVINPITTEDAVVPFSAAPPAESIASAAAKE